MKSKLLFASLVTGALPLFACADWPQYRGPTSDGITAEKMPSPWPAGGPKVLWKNPVGAGFGSFAVKGGKAWYLADADGQDACYSIDLKTGKELWSAKFGKSIVDGNGNGPRSTPVIDGDKVYALGTWLKLACFNAADGKVVWLHDLAAEFSGQTKTGGIKEWGSASSPVVEGDLVIVAGGGAGQAFMAFDKATGKVAWKNGDDKITHATPLPATIQGVRQAIFFMQSGLVALEPKTGERLWQYKFPFSVSTAASPVVSGDIVYCSAGYGVGGGACKISKTGDKFSATEIWRTPGKTINHWSTPVLIDGHLYGLFGFKEHKTEPLKCIELATGKEVWSQPGFGQGQVILVDGKLVVQGDQGQLVLVEPSPAGYKEISRCQPLVGKAWGFPAYTDGILLYRTNQQMAALQVAAEK